MSEVTYEEITSPSGEKMIQRTHPDGVVWFIPMDETNADYAAYLESLEAPAKAK